jgi:protein-disulfide isomerase
LIVIALVVVVIAGGAIYFFTRPDTTLVSSPDPAGSDSMSADDGLMVAGPLGEMSLGDPGAPVTVIEYASMTCSHCANFHNNVYADFKEKYIDTGQVRFILREYPLDPLATGAFIVARCVPENLYFPTVELLFEQQRQWTAAADKVEALFNLVRQTGLSRQQFDACLNDPAMLDGVNWVHDRADAEFGVDSTPTFFVNGELVQLQEISLEEISRAVDQHL